MCQRILNAERDQGTYCVPYVILSVTDSSGKQYGGQTRTCRQVIQPNLAKGWAPMLDGVCAGC